MAHELDRDQNVGSSPLSISDFVSATSDRERTDDGGQRTRFELENHHVLQINLHQERVWIKVGAMIAYTGQIAFEREGALEHGVGELLKRTFSGEGARLTKALGNGALYVADRGKRVTILDLKGESLFVNGSDLLAYEDGIESHVTMMRKIAALAAGGLFNVRLAGRGLVAITTHHRPLTLIARRGQPVFTDPQATVAWSASLTPEFKTDVQLKTFLGRGSGESFQMKFEGDGFVVVQPFEESFAAHSGGR